MEVTITTKAVDATEMMVIKKALQTLADNIDKDNFVFLADLSKKPKINDKLRSNKTVIKMSL